MGLLVVIALGVFVIILSLYLLFKYKQPEESSDNLATPAEPAIHGSSATVSIEEPTVDLYAEYRALRSLNPYPEYGEYLRFTNLVLESGYNTPYTEVDEVIVSRFGIFCVEQKDYQGVILGKKHDARWTQCTRNYRGAFMNPGRQNYKHLKSLEKLLSNKLNSSIHTYSYFPKAHKVITDDTMVFTSHQGMWNAIRSHSKPLYTLEEVTEIAKVLAYESSRKEIRSVIHIATLKYHLAAQQS